MTETSAVALATVDGEANTKAASAADLDYWNALIDEKVAADWMDVTPRKMQADRQRGDGPSFIRLSARCIKYTRGRLRAHAEARLRKSTADPGQGAA